MPDSRAVEAAPDVILIDNLRVQTRIGVYDVERERPQTVRFDVAIDTVSGYLDQVMTTDTYVSYADVVAFIEDKATSGEHVRLVEEWAAGVADFVLENPLVAQVTVSVLKMDIFEQADGVGIRIVRRRG